MTEEGYAWRKLSAAKWEDVWPERLSEFAERLAITSLAGKPTIQVEVFGITRGDADRLTKNFGGAAARQTREANVKASKGKPINVRGRLSIVASEAERSAV